MPIVAPTVSVGIHAFTTVGTAVTFATIPAAAGDGFDSVDAYVDPTNYAGISRLKWQLFAVTSGGAGVPVITALVAETLPISSDFGAYLPFGRIDAIEGVQYVLKAIAVDAAAGAGVTVKGGLIGYDRQANVAGALPVNIDGDTAALTFGTEVSFGSFSVYHTRLQVQVDAVGVANSDSNWTIVGTITDGGGNFVSAPIAKGSYNSATKTPTIVIQSLPNSLGINPQTFNAPNSLASETRGATSYELFGKSTNAAYDNATPVKASMIGYDTILSF